MAQSAKPRVVGFNHVALEVGDIEEALTFYGRLFEFELRGMGLTHLTKNENARRELAEKGMALSQRDS